MEQIKEDFNIEDLTKYPTFVQYIMRSGGGWTIMDKEGAERVIVTTYFAITSLSTVGFGDYYPVNDEERLAMSFVLLFGVMLFSIFMTWLIEMIDKFKSFDDDFNQDADLAKFLVMLRY